jgi:hypothetical protein
MVSKGKVMRERSKETEKEKNERKDDYMNVERKVGRKDKRMLIK